MSRVLLLALALIAVGCAPDPNRIWYLWTKGLNEIWSNQTNTIDLTKIRSTTVSPVNFTFANGAACQTNLAVSGAGTVGGWTITTSNYLGGGSGNPGCASLIDNYTYQNPTGFALIVCNSTAVCSTYY